MRKNRQIRRGKSRQFQTVDFHAEEITSRDDSFDECLAEFLDVLKYERNRAAGTIEFYRKELGKFRQSFEEQRLKTNLRAITADLIRSGYVRYRQDKYGVKHATTNAGLRALRAFLNWATEKRIISRSPFEDITIYKAEARPVETFSREQLFDILSQPDLKTFIGYRDFAIMTTLLETGARVRELCEITVDDIRFNDRQILLNGKNREPRLVPFQRQVGQILRNYLQARGGSPVDWLFITQYDEQMNRDSVRRRIAKYGRMAGIDNVRCSPHTFRHTFAKMSVQNGANIFELQKILGHKSLDMVRRYVNLFSDEVKKAHERFSPVKNLDFRF